MPGLTRAHVWMLVITLLVFSSLQWLVVDDRSMFSASNDANSSSLGLLLLRGKSMSAADFKPVARYVRVRHAAYIKNKAIPGKQQFNVGSHRKVDRGAIRRLRDGFNANKSTDVPSVWLPDEGQFPATIFPIIAASHSDEFLAQVMKYQCKLLERHAAARS